MVSLFMYSQQFFHIILISVLCTSIGDIPPSWPAAGALVTDRFCYIDHDNFLAFPIVSEEIISSW